MFWVETERSSLSIAYVKQLITSLANRTHCMLMGFLITPSDQRGTFVSLIRFVEIFAFTHVTTVFVLTV